MVAHLNWQAYVNDMIRFTSRAIDYSRGLTQEQFEADTMRFDATLRNIELVGEAANKIPAEIRNSEPEIPWRLVIATRNRLIHGYLGIDNDVIWSILQDELPKLLNQLRAIDESKR